jgi:hypothetical protein
MRAALRVLTGGWIGANRVATDNPLRAHLLADSALEDLVDTRIYPLTLPQNPTYPAIRYQRISRRPVHVKPGIVWPIANPRWQFDCYASTYSSARAVADALKESLYAYANPSAPKVYETLVDSEFEAFDDLTQTYQVSIDALIWEAEES